MTAHTPGQWRLQDNAEHWQTNPYSVTVRAHGVHGVTIANCPARAKIPASQAKANARLIAAAPNLLRLLIDIEAHLYGGAALHPGSLIFAEDAPAHDVIVDAIAKATREDAQ